MFGAWVRAGKATSGRLLWTASLVNRMQLAPTSLRPGNSTRFNHPVPDSRSNPFLQGSLPRTRSVIKSSSLKIHKASWKASASLSSMAEEKSTPAKVAENGSATGKESAVSVVDFLTLCQRLKTTKRTGWVNHKVNGPESIADHMYRMSIMAFLALDATGVQRDRCIKIAIVHDIAEAIVGDITPSCGISKEEKSCRERAAIEEMCETLGNGAAARELRELWEEYEGNATPEAKLVKDFDKIEMILQAHEYESEQGKDLSEFFASTQGKFQTDLGKQWAEEVCRRRKAL